MKDASYIRKLQKDIVDKDKAKKSVEGVISIIERKVINGYQGQKYSFGVKVDNTTIDFLHKIIDEFENLGFTAEFDYSTNMMTIFWNEG